MANLTAASTRFSDRIGSLEQISYRAMDGQDYWRGGAVVLRRSGGNDITGLLDRTLDGTVDAVFAGVVIETVKPRDAAGNFLTQAQLDGRRDLEVAVKRRGSMTFTGSGFAIPGSGVQGDIGKRVFFTDDQTVSLTPPSQDYPISPGRIVRVYSATEVEVELEPGYFPAWQELCLGGGSIAAVAAVTDIEILTDYLFDQRVFVREALFAIQVPVGGADLDDIRVDKGTTEIGTEATPVLATADVAGVVKSRALNTVFEATDTLSIIFGSAGEVTGGEISVIVRYLPIA